MLLLSTLYRRETIYIRERLQKGWYTKIHRLHAKLTNRRLLEH